MSGPRRVVVTSVSTDYNQHLASDGCSITVTLDLAEARDFGLGDEFEVVLVPAKGGEESGPTAAPAGAPATTGLHDDDAFGGRRRRVHHLVALAGLLVERVLQPSWPCSVPERHNGVRPVVFLGRHWAPPQSCVRRQRDTKVPGAGGSCVQRLLPALGAPGGVS